eukprot:1619728-Ditylum_brightwellii.AAC.1
MSPEGRYQGLYKTWLKVPEESKINYKGIKTNNFFTMIQHLLTVCRRHATPLTRWLNVHNLYILKKPNIFKIHWLRTIQKVDSEVNMMRRELITRRLMKNAKKHKHLDDAQHRGGRGRSAIDIVLGKAFTFEILHLQRSNLGCTDCDATACYNQIILIILLLAYIKVGLPYKTGVFLMTILYSKRYKTTTAFGTNTKQNTYDTLKALFGIGQGSADGPTGWTCVIDPGLKCYNRMAKGCTLNDPSCTSTTKANTDMLFDDVTLTHKGENPNDSPTKLMDQIQFDANLWAKILWVTGELLEFMKSLNFILIWKFQPNGRPVITPDNELLPNSICLLDSFKQSTKLR